MLTLGDLHIGQDAIIRVVGGEGELRHHLLDMGLTPGTEVTLRKTAPMGDPIEVELRGYELTLRLADAQKIEIDSVHATDRAAPSEERHKVVAHPGVGELDKAASYHERTTKSFPSQEERIILFSCSCGTSTDVSVTLPVPVFKNTRTLSSPKLRKNTYTPIISLQ